MSTRHLGQINSSRRDARLKLATLPRISGVALCLGERKCEFSAAPSREPFAFARRVCRFVRPIGGWRKFVVLSIFVFVFFCVLFFVFKLPAGARPSGL